MNEAVFGEAKEAEAETRVKVTWPYRSANTIEGELRGRMAEALALYEHRAPLPFIEDDEFANADDYAALYGPVTVHEALALRDVLAVEVLERFRRQLILARELGGNPALYEVACEVEQIRSLP